MRTGACSVQQALTPEAATVLKLSLSLAKRRGHAQVTPLHVAATLLSSTSTTSSPFPNLLRRACLKSQPPHHHPASHPLHCRALELCFNVALNRLPTTPPPSSGPLTAPHLHHSPSLSNALIAALKRAQAHQRRGSIELQHQLQTQQPLLAIKVELEQLIISILDDPSVSRVMREAGFSSTCVKTNLEEDTINTTSSSSAPPFFESHRDITLWQSPHFLRPPSEHQPPGSVHSLQKEDIRVVLEVMLRKQGRRSNTVVVGDSASSTEGLVAELMGRVERCEVPEELRAAQFLRLNLSSLHLRLMSRGDVDAKVSDLRTRIESIALEKGGGGSVIVYAGDLRWAVDEERKDKESSSVCGNGFKPVEHLISEVGKLLSELKSLSGNGVGGAGTKVWLMATASYQTYMRCLVRHPSIETQWALQAVVVPSGGLALSLQAPSGMDSRLTKLSQYPFQLIEPKALHPKEEQEKFLCCAECTSNYEKEATKLASSSLLSSSKPLSTNASKDISNGSPHLPAWLRPHRPDSHHKDSLIELKRKWSRLCQRLHHSRHNHIHLYPTLFNQNPVSKNYSYSSPNPWWSASPPYTQSKIFAEPHSIAFLEPSVKIDNGNPQSRNDVGIWPERDVSKQWGLSEVSLHSLKKPTNQDLKTTLALSSPLFADSATSKESDAGVSADQKELFKHLEKNIHWQSEAIPSIAEAFLDYRSNTKGTCLLLQGADHIAKRRLALVAAESICGSMDKLVRINTMKLAGKSCNEILLGALTKDPKCVILIEFIDRAGADFTRMFTNTLNKGFLEDPIGEKVGLGQAIFILSTMGPTCIEKSDDKVVKFRLHVEELSPDFKRKLEWDSPVNEPKKRRTTMESILDLNVCAEEEDGEDNDVPSDLTQVMDDGDNNLPADLLDLIGARLTLDFSPDRSRRMTEGFHSKLRRAFEEAYGSGEELDVDQTVVEELMEVSGCFLESQFEEWLREVFQTSLATVKKGGKVRLGADGKEVNLLEFGFHGLTLPNMISMCE